MRGHRLKTNLYEDSDFIDIKIPPLERQLTFCDYCAAHHQCKGTSYFNCGCNEFPYGPPLDRTEVAWKLIVARNLNI